MHTWLPDRQVPLLSRAGEQGPDAVPPDGELALKEADPALKRPKRYLVVMLNDDYTPMHFVVEILQQIFAMDESAAVRIMLDIHTKGSGICGIYTREIAETKCAQVIECARLNEHPLKCRIEPSMDDDSC